MTTHTTTPDDLLTYEQAAEMIGRVTPRTLRNWASAGRGPKRLKLGPRLVRYRAGDVQAWLEQQYI